MAGVLEGKTALVTGASRSIGRTIAQRLAASGALVAINYATNTAAAQETVAMIESKGGTAFALQAELGPDGSTEKLVTALQAELQQRIGDTGLDILINNVGGSRSPESWTTHASPARIEAVTAEDLDRTFSVNFKTPFLLTQALMPRLRDGGRIVNISSATVRVGFEYGPAYVCSKAALDMFTRLLAKHEDIGGRGITANSVAVGRTAGETNAAFYSNPDNLAGIVGTTALRRVGTEGDIAGVVHALVSPEGAWITGQVIDATGGYKI